jgi:hypothetical protein
MTRVGSQRHSKKKKKTVVTFGSGGINEKACDTHFIYIAAFSQNFEKRLLALSCLSVRPSLCPSVRMEQLGCHW